MDSFAYELNIYLEELLDSRLATRYKNEIETEALIQL